MTRVVELPRNQMDGSATLIIISIFYLLLRYESFI